MKGKDGTDMKISKCRSMCLATLTGCALLLMSSNVSPQLAAKEMAPSRGVGDGMRLELKVETGQAKYHPRVVFPRWREAIVWALVRQPRHPVAALWVWFAVD